MIKRSPTLLALLVAATLAAACSDAVDGAPSAPRSSSPSTATGPTAFPSTLGADPRPATGSAGSSAPAASAAGSAGATPAAASTIWSSATARRNYLAYVSPYNDAIRVLNTIVSSKKSTVADYQVGCTAVATNQAHFAQRLLEGRWPANARAAIIDFVPLIEKSVNGFQLCGEARSIAQAQSQLKKIPVLQSAADRVRVALGLPKTAAK